MDKIFNVISFDPTSDYGSEITFYHVECTEEEIKDVVKKLNLIEDHYYNSWSYEEMKLTQLKDILTRCAFKWDEILSNE